MNELSLFSGAGGGLLGTKLLGWRTVGYVENNLYCTKILRARIDDGILDEAPIFGDINSFIESGAVDQYQGITDVLTAGFPCPAYSVAGRREGKFSEKNLWPQTLAVIRLLRPHLRYAFLENVPGLLSVNAGEMFAQILSDLAESGFDARWTVLGADDVGAPHRRKRLWILAYSNSKGSQGFGGQSESVSEQETEHPAGDSCQENRSGWWESESSIRRVAHGVANRMDRLRCLGNGQVPRVVATAWEILTDESDR